MPGIQRSLSLIVARELASNLATPMFLIDAEGTVAFYNEAAEDLLGRPFGELGSIDALAWGEMLALARPDGSPLRRRDSPPGVAFFERRPAHDRLRATAHDGTERLVEVTAFPLFAKPGELEGVLAIFWELDG